MGPYYTCKEAGPAGQGLFASTAIHTGTPVLQEVRPLLAVLDSHYLKEACSWCFRYTGESSEDHILSVCTGCRILRFCGKECQGAAWKHSHKLECKQYQKLYPAVLPNTARMLMQILLRRKRATFTQEEWTSLQGLTHHIENFKRHGGGETYQNIQLMSRAAAEYGETGDELGLIENMAGRIIINSMTLTSPLFTPLGITLSVKTALINHSCDPNSVITYSGPSLTVQALRSIKAGEELTISYIENTFSPMVRRNELQSRYFFECNCNACINSFTLGRPDPPPEISFTPVAELNKLEETAMQHLSEALQAKGPSLSSLCHLARALRLFDQYPSFPAWRQPLAKIRTDTILQLLAHRHYIPALLQSLKQRFEADPVTFPEEAHPVRVTRAFILSKLMMQMESMSLGNTEPWQENGEDSKGWSGGQDVRDLQIKFKADWQIFTWALVAEVAKLVERSHGKATRLEIEVKQAVKDMKIGLRSTGKAIPDNELIDESFKKMKRLSNEGWDFWRSWSNQVRKGKPFDATYSANESDQDPISILTSITI